MNITNTIRARGQVAPYFINASTGKREPWKERHNTISYEASLSMAAAFGGDLTFVPNRIGIIYGSSDTPEFTTILRSQNWDSLESELRDRNADVQVRSFSYTPSLKTVSKGTNPTVYGHAITFHSHSDYGTAGAFGTHKIGGEAKSFIAGKYIYQAVLLNYSNQGYKILARASLDKDGSYQQKPDGFEVAIDWSIKFF